MNRIFSILISVMFLTPTLAHDFTIKLDMNSVHSFEGCAMFYFAEGLPGIEHLRSQIIGTGTAQGDYCTWVTPSLLENITFPLIDICAELRHYQYNLHAGEQNLEVATVIVQGWTGTAWVDLISGRVLMDVPYYVNASSGNHGHGGVEAATHAVSAEMINWELCTVEPDEGYVFTGWQGEAVAYVPDPMSPTLHFDWLGYFSESSKQCYLFASFALPNTEEGTDVYVPLQDSSSGTTAEVVFDNIVSVGYTGLKVTNSGPDVPSDYVLAQPPRYFDISTTAGCEGMILVSLSYSGLTFSCSPTALRLLHYEDGSWEDCTTGIDENEQMIFGQVDSLSPFVVALRTVIEVEIDIKPGSYPNSINLNGHGVIPVAIFGRADFDVAQIDPLSLDLAGMGVKIKKNGRPQCSFEDVNGDGYEDLTCHFLDSNTTWTEGMTTAPLSGSLFDGTPIEGSDEVRLVP